MKELNGVMKNLELKVLQERLDEIEKQIQAISLESQKNKAGKKKKKTT